MDNYPGTTELLKRELDETRDRLHKEIETFCNKPSFEEKRKITNLLCIYFELAFTLRGRL